MKQTGKIRGQIFHGGFASETECSERKKKMKKQTYHASSCWNKLIRFGDKSSIVDSWVRLNAVEIEKNEGTNQHSYPWSVTHFSRWNVQSNKQTYKHCIWNKLKRLGDKSSMVDSRARPNAVKEKKKMKKQTNYWKREMLLCCASFYQSRYHSLAKHVIRLINTA